MKQEHGSTGGQRQEKALQPDLREVLSDPGQIPLESVLRGLRIRMMLTRRGRARLSRMEALASERVKKADFVDRFADPLLSTDAYGRTVEEPRSRFPRRVKSELSQATEPRDLSRLNPQEYATASNALDEVLERYPDRVDAAAVGSFKMVLEQRGENERDAKEIVQDENRFEGPVGDDLTAKDFALAAAVLAQLPDPEVTDNDREGILLALRDRQDKLQRAGSTVTVRSTIHRRSLASLIRGLRIL